MRRSSPTLLLLAIVLLAGSVGVALLERGDRLSGRDRSLSTEATEQATIISSELNRAREISRLSANNPAFREYYRQLGDRRPTPTTRRGLVDVEVIEDVEGSLGYLAKIFPSSIGEACFVDRAGTELARAVAGTPLPSGELLADKSDRPFFAPAFALRRGQVYQARPFVSKDTKDWVIPTATEVTTDDRRERAIVHFDLKIESIRRAMAQHAGRSAVQVVDGDSGAVLIDSREPQEKEGELGRPRDLIFASLVGRSRPAGLATVDGTRAAYRRVGPRSRQNDNDWYVVVTPSTADAGLVLGVGAAPAALLLVALIVLVLAIVNLHARQEQLHSAATSDSLTRLGNRRRLMTDLERALERAEEGRSLLLVVFDLDGFKTYNDTFGHPAGDWPSPPTSAARSSRLGSDSAAATIPSIVLRSRARIRIRTRAGGRPGALVG